MGGAANEDDALNVMGAEPCLVQCFSCGRNGVLDFLFDELGEGAPINWDVEVNIFIGLIPEFDFCFRQTDNGLFPCGKLDFCPLGCSYRQW